MVVGVVVEEGPRRSRNSSRLAMGGLARTVTDDKRMAGGRRRHLALPLLRWARFARALAVR